MAEVGVIGAGSWGIALAKLLHTNGNKVTVWSIVEDEIKMLQEKHEHVYTRNTSFINKSCTRSAVALVFAPATTVVGSPIPTSSA